MIGPNKFEGEVAWRRQRIVADAISQFRKDKLLNMQLKLAPGSFTHSVLCWVNEYRKRKYLAYQYKTFGLSGGNQRFKAFHEEASQ